MRRFLPLVATVCAAMVLVPALPATAATPRAPKLVLHNPWAGYVARPGSRQMQLSGAAYFALRGLDLQKGTDGGVSDAFPATGIPNLPAGFRPNVIVNQDRSAMPHNETAVAINPKNPKNILVGANDYSPGFGNSGAYASFDGGATWYGTVLPVPASKYCIVTQITGQACPASPIGIPNLQTNPEALDGGGDPAVAFDRDGVAYYADINFHRVGCISGVFVARSTNGGQTWSRPLYGPASSGDTKISGDGVVDINPNDNNCSTFDDKEFIATGARPSGTALVANTDMAHLSPDRVYVTWSAFHQNPAVQIPPYVGNGGGAALEILDSATMLSYSDDQGRHWSTPAFIGGTSSAYCAGFTPEPFTTAPNSCADSQGSSPATDPRTGKVYVSFNNDDANDSACPDSAPPILANSPAPFSITTHQVLVVSSTDGGATWGAPARAGCDNGAIPAADATGCPGAGGQGVVSYGCWRVPIGSTGTNTAINPVDGSVHIQFMTNQGGTNWSGSSGLSDVEIYTAVSTDGGKTFAKPVHVSSDGSKKDKFFPWGIFGPDGTFYLHYLDRSYDPAGKLVGATLATSADNGASWALKQQSTGLFDGNKGFRNGLFLGDYDQVAASPLGAFAAWPDTRRAGEKRAGDNPLDTWSDIAGAATYPLTSPAGGVFQLPTLPLPNTGLGRALAVMFLLGLGAGLALGYRVFAGAMLLRRRSARSVM